MRCSKKKQSFAIFCLATTIVEEVVLVAVLLWLLPHFNINIPLWLFILIVLAWAAWSYLTYRLGKNAIGRSPVVGSEAMVGTCCQTITRLCPSGYVQAGTELWRAYSIAGDIDAGVKVVIVGIKGLTLFVILSSDTAIMIGLPRREAEGRMSPFL
jgi:membrane-bound ClpP family serine protease